MSKKIIFFDIDGTISSHRDFTISKRTREAIKEAQNNGHLAVINTGRTFSELDNEILDIGFDGYICGCGTYILYENTLLLHKTISSDLIRDIISDLHKFNIDACLEGVTAIYYNQEVKAAIFNDFKKTHVENNLNVRTWDDPDISFNKFCIHPLQDGDFDSFYNKYNQSFDFINREDAFHEVVPKGYSKATAIDFMCNHLNIPYENTYALGDSNNDYAMLKYVKHSIAMGNASENILKMASFITKDVDEDGVAYALKHYSII